jgi:branched-chain amino acid transport system substrate-binding protein
MQKLPQSSLDTLRKVDIFQPFSAEDLFYLSQRARQHHYHSGDTVVHEGDSGDSLFVVADGVVGIWMKLGESSLNVASLGAGSFFGEMALLTGKPRSATVVSVTETYLLEITKADIAPLFAHQPEVSQRISEVLAERQSFNQAQLKSGKADTQLSRALLDEIQNVYGLKKS